MSSHPHVTQTAYEPAAALPSLLTDVLEVATISYGDEHQLDLGEGLAGMQRTYRVTYEEFEVTGTETFSSLGVILSLEGHLGCAASIVLTNTLAYGVPTRTYTDEAPPATLVDDPYQDLTAEWYRQSAVRAGLPELRLQRRIGDLDHDLIGLGTVEHYAEIWLSAGSE